jgi:hypothetical protein
LREHRVLNLVEWASAWKLVAVVLKALKNNPGRADARPERDSRKVGFT